MYSESARIAFADDYGVGRMFVQTSGVGQLALNRWTDAEERAKKASDPKQVDEELCASFENPQPTARRRCAE